MDAKMSSRFKELTAKFPSAFALSSGAPSPDGGGLFQLLGQRGSAEAFPFFASPTLEGELIAGLSDLPHTPSGGTVDRAAVAREGQRFAGLPEVRSAADGAAWLLKDPRAPRSKKAPPVASEQRSTVPPPTEDEGRFLGWFGDGTVPYPEALWARYQIPLHRLLIVRTPSAEETWRLGAEACGTGLFRAICLQPSAGTDGTTLRRLQLSAERHGVTVALLTDGQLPHWPLSARWHCGP